MGLILSLEFHTLKFPTWLRKFFKIVFRGAANFLQWSRRDEVRNVLESGQDNQTEGLGCYGKAFPGFPIATGKLRLVPSWRGLNWDITGL